MCANKGITSAAPKCEIPLIVQAPRTQPLPEEEEDAEEEETEELGHVDTYAEYKPSKCTLD